MSLFSFGDIKFNASSGNPKGPLVALEGSEFEKTTLRYPIDVGASDKSHYLVFYIKQQKTSSFKGTPAKSSIDEAGTGPVTKDIPNIVGNKVTNFGGELLGKLNGGLSQINSLTGGALSGVTGAISGAAGSVVGSVNNLFGQSNRFFGGDSAASSQIINNSIQKITGGSLAFLKTTELTTDAIALYMPDTLNYTYSQSYDQLTLGTEAGGQAIAAGKGVVDAYKSGDAGAVTAALGKSAVEVGKQKIGEAVAAALGSPQTGQAILASTGRVQNPMLEMVYKSPNFRQFQFDFTFYPRDEKEAYEVQRIIERLRFHQAPELLEGAQGFLVPPSEFDIRFYYGGAQNPNIPQIATCVLTSIDTNYAPNGFSAYEVPGENTPAIGRTGMPVAISLSLQFQETTYLTKADFNLSLAKG